MANSKEILNKIIRTLNEKYGMSRDAAMKLILLCVAFDVKTMISNVPLAKELDGRTLEIVEDVVNNEEFDKVIEELKKELKEKQNA